MNRHYPVYKRLLFLSLFLLAGATTLFGQTVTYTAGNSQHTTLSQTQIAVQFTAAGGATGVTFNGAADLTLWTVKINGTTVTVTNAVALGFSALVTFDATALNGVPFIKPGQTMTIAYAGGTGAGKLEVVPIAAGNYAPAMSDNSVNNWVFACTTDLIFYQQGDFSGVDICAPVVMNFHQYQYKASLRYRNSSQWAARPIFFQMAWGDGVNQTVTPYLSDDLGNASATNIDATGFTGSNPAVVLTSRQTHTYPDTVTPTPDCTWNASLTPFVNAPVSACSSIITTTEFPTYDTDNTNSGTLNLPPAVAGTDKVCLGTNVNMQFSDNTVLNCRAAYTDLPNEQTRYIRFVYGSTNAGAPGNIPDIFVTPPAAFGVGITQITNNDATGTLIFPSGFSPTGAGGIGIPDFNGVIQLATPVTVATATAYMGQITTLLTNNQAVGQLFYVRMDYWDVCNAYNPATPTSPAPVSIQNFVQIVTKPVALTTAGLSICYNAGNSNAFNFSASSTLAAPPRTAVNWYNKNPQAGGATLMTNPNGTNSLNFPASAYTVANSAVGAPFKSNVTTGAYYSVWATQVVSSSNNCESNPIEVVIVQQPDLSSNIPAIPGGSTAVCNGTPNIYTEGTAPPTMTIAANSSTNGSAISLTTEDIWTENFPATTTFTPATGASTTVTFAISPEPSPNVTDNVSVALRYAANSISVVSPLSAPNTQPTYTISTQQCTTTTSNLAVTVSGVSSPGTIAPTTQTICDGSAITNITITNGATVLRGSITGWEVSVNGGAFTADGALGTASTVTPVVPIVGGVQTTYAFHAIVKNGTCAPATSASATIIVNPSPTTATLAGGATICSGNSTNLTVTIAGGTSPYTVKYSDGTVTTTLAAYVSGTNIPVSPASTKTYTLVSVTDAKGCTPPSLTGSALVTISNPTSATLAGTAAICFAGTTNLTVTVAGGAGASPYSVIYKAGAVVQPTINGYISGANIPVSPVATTTYSLVSVTDANGCPALSTPGTPTVTVGSAIGSASFGGGGSVCKGLTENLALTITGGVSPYSITVNNGIGTIAGYVSGTAIPVPTTVVGTVNYSVTLITDACGNSFAGVVSNNPQSVTVNALPTANNQTPTVCSDASGGTTATVDLTALQAAINGGGGISYTWFTAYNAGTKVFSGPIATPAAAVVTGGTPVFAKVTDGNTCVSPATVTYTVNARPNTPTGGTGSTYCSSGSPTAISATPPGGSTLDWYSAPSGGVVLAGGTGVTSFTPPSSGNYYAQSRNTTSGCTSTARLLVVSTMDTAPAAAVAGPNQPNLCGTTATLAATPATNGGSGLWTVLSGGPVTFANASLATTGVSGLTQNAAPFNIVLKWTVSSALGVCPQTSATVTLTTNPLPTTTDPAPHLCEDVAGGGSHLIADMHFYDALVTNGTTVTWFKDVAHTMPLAASPSPITVNNSTQKQVFFHSVSAVGCAKDFQITFVVDPLPSATTQNLQFCEDFVGAAKASGINLTSFQNAVTGGAANRQVDWYTDAGLTTLIPPGTATGDNQNFTITATTTVYAKVTDTSSPVTPTKCFNQANVNLTLVLRPVNNPIVGNATVCSDPTNIQLYQVDPTKNPGSNFTWTVAGVPAGSVQLFGGGGTNSSNFFALLKFPAAGTVTLTMVETLNGCIGNTSTYTVNVSNAPGAITINGPTSVCTGASGITYTVPSANPGSIYTWTVSGATVVGPSSGPGLSTITVDYGVVTPVTIQVAETSSSGCVGSPASIIVNESPVPSMTSTANSSVCSGATPSLSFTSAPGTNTYSWTVSSITGAVTGTSVGATGSGNLGTTFTGAGALKNVSGAVGSVTFNVTPTATTSPNCVGNSQSVVLTVNPEPVLVSPQTKTICSGQQVNYEIMLTPLNLPAGTVFNWPKPTMSDLSIQGSAGSNVAAGPAGTIHITDVLTNSSATAITATYTVTPSNTVSGCPGTPQNVVITVNPQPVLSGALNATRCSQTSIGLTLSTAGGSVAANNYNVTAISIGAGLSAAGTNAAIPGTGVAANYLANDSYSNFSTSAANVTYTIVPVSISGCGGTPTLVTIAINPEPVLATGLDASVCSGVASGIIMNTKGTSVPAPTYNIVGKTVAIGLTGGGSNAIIPGIGVAANYIANDVYTNTGNTSLTVIYQVVPVSGSSCLGSPPVPVTLTVLPQPVVSTTLNNSVCSRSVTGLVLNTNGSSVVAASYQVTAISVNAGLTASGANATVPSAGPVTASYLSNDSFTNTGTAALPVMYTVVPVSAAGCFGTPQQITITINPEPVVPVLDETICSDIATGLTLATNGTSVGAANYNITSRTITPGLTPNVGNAAVPASGVAANYLAADVFTNTGSLPLTVVYKVVPVSSTGCLGVSRVITITIDPEPVVSTTLNATVCSEVPIGLTLNTNGSSVAASTYNITSVTMAGGLVAGGGNAAVPQNGVAANYLVNDTYTNSTGAVGKTVVYVVVPVSLAGCLGNPQSITITVNPEPDLSTALDNTVCSGIATGLTLNTNGTSVGASNYSVTVISVPAGLTPAGTNAVVASNVTANYLANDKFTNVGSSSLTVQYTVVANSASGCPGPSKVVNITINPEPVVATTLDATVCSDIATGLLLNTNGSSVGAATYNITARAIGGGLVPAATNVSVPASGAAANYLVSDVFTNTTTLSSTVKYTVVPVSAVGCTGAPQVITITVNPEPVISSTLNKTVCSNTAIGLTLSTTGTSVAAANYNITNIVIGAGLTAGGSNVAVPSSAVPANFLANDQYANTTAASVTVTYTVVPISGVGCMGDPQNIVITINPQPVVATTLDATVCSEAATGLTLNTNGTSVAAANYNITSRTVPAGLTSSGNVAVPATGVAANYLAGDKFTNTTAAPLIVVYKVVPVAGNGCLGDTKQINITISPEPVLSALLNLTQCSHLATGLILNTNGSSVAAQNYNITSVVMAAGLTASGTNAAFPATGVNGNYLASDVFTNTGASPLTVTYKVVPVSASGCLGQSVNVVVTINPEPVVSTTLNLTVCSEVATGLTLATNGTSVAANNYNVLSITVPGSITAGGGNVIAANNVAANYLANDVFTNTTASPANVTYVVVPVSAAGCLGASQTITVAVNPEPVVANGLDATVCSDAVIGLTLNTNGSSVAAANYNITARTIDAALTPAASNATVPATAVAANYLAADKFTNTGLTPKNVTYTVVPVSGATCTGGSKTITIAINPKPVVSSLLNATVCSHLPIGLTLTTNGTSVSAANYNIVSRTPNAALVPGGTNVAVPATTVAANYLINDTFTNTTGGALTVVYVVVPVSPSGCLGDPKTITMTVSPEPVVSSTLSTAVCSEASTGLVLATNGTSVAASTYNVTAIAKDAGLTAVGGNAVVASGVAANYLANDKFINTSATALHVVYSVVPVSALTCKGASLDITVTINPEPVVATTLNATVCSETATGLTLATSATSVAAATYNVTNISVTAGLTPSVSNATPANGVAANYLAADQFTNTGAAFLTVSYTVVPVSAGGCVGQPQTIVIKINPEPVVGSGLNKTVCSESAGGLTLATNGTSVAAANYNITSVTIPAGVTAIAVATVPATGVAANYLATDSYKNVGNSSLDVLYTVVPVSAANCAGQPLVVKQTVNPQPVLGALDKSVCSEAAIALTLATNGTSVNAANYNVTAVTIPAGLTAGGSNAAIPGTGVSSTYLLNDKYTNTGTTPLIVHYTVVPVSAIPCAGDPVDVKITISPEPVLAGTLNATVCSEAVSGITLATNGTSVAATTYNITNIVVAGALVPKAGNAIVGNGLAASAIANDSFTNTMAGPLTVTYTVIPVSAAGCQGVAVPVVLTVNPEPVMDPSLSTASICSHGNTNVTLNTNGVSVAAASYNVSLVSQDAGLTGTPTTGTALASGAIFNDIFVNVQAIPLKVVYQVTPKSAGNCFGRPFTITVTVNPEPVVNTGLNNTVCSRDISGIILSTNGISVAANSYTLVGVTVPATITADPSNAAVGSTSGLDLIKNDFYTNTTSGPVVVKYQIQGTSPQGCIGQVQEIDLTVSPQPILAPGTATLCSDVPSGIILGPAAGSAVITQYVLKAILKAAQLVAGPSNAGLGTYSTNNFLAGDQFTNTTTGALTVTYTIAAVASGCVGADQTIVFTVNPAPAVASNLNKTVCTSTASGITFATETSPLSAAAASYNILSVAIQAGLTQTAGNTGARSGVSANEVKNDVFKNPTNGTLTVTYTVQGVTAAACVGPSKDVVLTVEPTITAAPVNSKPDICSSDRTNISLVSPTVPSSGPITFNYTATSSVGGLISGFIPSVSNLPAGSVITDSLVNNSPNPATVTYSIMAIANGAQNGFGCSGTAVNVVVTVEPKPKVVASPLSQTVCEGAPTSISLTTTTTPTTGVVQFTVTATPTGGMTLTSPATPKTTYLTGQQINDVWSNPDVVMHSVTYTIQPVVSGGLGCTGDVVTVTVNVNPLPNLTASTQQQICSNETINIILTSDVDNTINTWTAAVVAGSASGQGPGAGDLIFQTLKNTGVTPATVRYTITPKANACAGTPITVDVVINPTPDIVGVPATANVCYGGTLNVPLNSSVGGAVFSWTVSPFPNSEGVAATGSGTVINQVLTNNTGVEDFLTYTITAAYPGTGVDTCFSIPKTLTVVAAPKDSVSFLNPNTWLCEGQKDFLQVQLDGQAPFTFTYSQNGAVQPPITKAGGFKSIEITPALGVTVYKIESMTDAFGCSYAGPFPSVTYTVGTTDATFSVVGPTASCSPYQVHLQYNQKNGTEYDWRWGDGTPDSIYTATTDVTNQIVKHTYSNTSPTGTLKPKIVLQTDLPAPFPGCFSSTTQTISIYPTIITNIYPDKTTLCSGDQVTFTNQSFGVTSYHWFYRVQGPDTTHIAGSDVASQNVTYTMTNTSTSNPIVYEVVYRSTNGNCPAPEVVTPITVYRNIIASFDDGGAAPHYLVGGNATVTVTNTSVPIDPGFSYVWDFGPGATPPNATGPGPFSVNYNSQGVKTISLIATNIASGALSCSSQYQDNVTIELKPLVASYVAAPLAACFPADIKVVSNASTGDVMLWQLYDGNGALIAVSNDSLPIFHITNPSTYTLLLKTSNSLVPSQTPAVAPPQTFVVYDKPFAAFEALPHVVYVPNTELTTINNSLGASGYLWDFGDQSPTSTDVSPKHTYTVEGSYTLTLIAENDHGGGVICTDTTTQLILAKQGGVSKLPNAFTPNPNGPTGGVSVSGSNYDVFLPNIKGVEEYNLQIFDRWGNLIFESNSINVGWDGYDRNGKLMPGGVYVYKITLRLSDGQRTTQVGDVTMIR
jgi:gliding motility-associated-like protein